MSGDDGLVLGELLCARLCHDLAGAIGAVGTGIELLSDEDSVDDEKAEALALLEASASAAIGRLKFFRVALGSASGTYSSPQLYDLIVKFLGASGTGGGSITLDWGAIDRAEKWGADDAKLLLNLVILARDSLPRGGVVRIEMPKGDGAFARVVATGLGVMPTDAAAALSATGPSGLGPRGIQGYYTAGLARRLGRSVNYEDSHDSMIFVMAKS